MTSAWRHLHSNRFVCILDKPRWLTLSDRVGVSDAADRFDMLCQAYSEPHRRYHTARHIVDCLTVLDQAEELASHPEAVEFAIWLHDFAYDPRRTNNEEKSAAVAVDWLPAHPPAVRNQVRRLVLATRHTGPPASDDEGLIQDIDLHILGSSPGVFDRYEAAIRREYASVPDLIYRQARRRILAQFLQREHLYNTPWFRSRFEAQARANLERSLSRLQAADV